VALGLGGGRVEPDAVVAQDELDLVADGLDREPDVLGLRVLQRVHHSLAGDVVQEQRDRRRERHLVDVGVELDVGLARRLGDEAVERLGEAGPPER